MNSYGHAWLASRRGGAPLFTLGAMLPDWLPWLGVRPLALDHPELAAGVRFHHRSDAAFHAGPRFAALVREAGSALRRAGLGRGPSRGAAHVGVELLLDAAWLEDPRGHGPYLAALEACGEAAHHVAWSRPEGAPRWAELGRWLQERGLPCGDADGRELAARIARSLARRPRLRLAEADLPAVARWLDSARAQVRGAAPAVLAETEAALT